jgi:hypothetical protein
VPEEEVSFMHLKLRFFFVFFCGYLALRPLLACCASLVWSWTWLWRSRWNVYWQGKQTEVLGENLPQRHFCPSQNPTWPDSVLNPGRGSGKPATNHLSYGAVLKLCFSNRWLLTSCSTLTSYTDGTVDFIPKKGVTSFPTREYRLQCSCYRIHMAYNENFILAIEIFSTGGFLTPNIKQGLFTLHVHLYIWLLLSLIFCSNCTCSFASQSGQ